MTNISAVHQDLEPVEDEAATQSNSTTSVKRKHRSFIQPLQFLTLVVGLVFTFWEIRTFVSEQRQNRSIQFVTQYYSNSEQLLENVLEITEIQFSGVKEYTNVDKDADFENDPEGYFRAARSYIVQKFEEAELESVDTDGDVESILVDIVRVSSFFDNVAACSMSGSCDRGIVAHGLQQEMYTFFNAMCAVYPQVQDMMNTRNIMANTVQFLGQDEEWGSRLYVCQDVFDRLSAI